MTTISLMTIPDNFCTIYKISIAIFNFNDIEIKKSTFYKSKYPTYINEVDFDKTMIS